MKEEAREELLKEAYQKGYDYLPRWNACAPTTFAAIMDTLGYGDDPAVNAAWQATIGLTGGTGNMTIGTCGAMAGAAAAISYSFGIDQSHAERDNNKVFLINKAVAEIGERMKLHFGHIVCQEVQFHIWGKAYRFDHPEVLGEFRNMARNTSGKPKCQDVVGTLACLAVEKILEYSPQFVKR
jgi:hypothetical protein